MSNDPPLDPPPPLDPLPEDVTRALAAERSRGGPPETTKSGIIARIEGSDQFRTATGAKQVGTFTKTHPLAAVKTRTGLVIFAAGALWGAVLGATVVALMKVPALAPTQATSTTADAGR